ncbi:MAG: hypothetical protein L3K14_06185 [Thermoplasmata archaeon]|nr:hypothetical protein [Thermoplasmata archaeon]
MSPASAAPKSDDTPRRHLHVRLADDGASIFDHLTEYLQEAGKAPDWYWRTAGRLEGEEDADNLEELLFSAFEAGASLAHDHPEELRFDWVTDVECERQRRAEEQGSQKDDARKERTSLSHYA